MKRLIAFTAAVVAFLACNKEITSENTVFVSNVSGGFEKGQSVTLTCKLNGDDRYFVWLPGDKIKVSVGSEYSAFTLSRYEGNIAEFEGKMPDSGDSFDVRFPVSGPSEENLAEQSFVEDGFSHNLMLATATGCTLGGTLELNPQYSVLKLNLYGPYTEVSAIELKNISVVPNTSYKLTAYMSQRIGTIRKDSTAFHVVVNPGSFAFKAELTTKQSSDAGSGTRYVDGNGIDRGAGTVFMAGTLVSGGKVDFNPGAVTDMPVTSVAAVWAPVNCGYDTTSFKNGKLYQFGRMQGGEYVPDTGSGETKHVQGARYVEFSGGFNSKLKDADFNDSFYANGSSPYDWYTDDQDSQFASWPMKAGDPGYLEGKIANPCPSGWRVPTESEFKMLLGNGSSTVATSDWTASKSSVSGRTFFSDSRKTGNSLFLPAGGYRSYSSGDSFGLDVYGDYWSSSTNGEYAVELRFGIGYAYMYSAGRALGHYVRCVQE